MKKNTLKAGLISSALLFIILLFYTIGLILLILSKPDQWINIDAYIKQINMTWHSFLTLCHILVFLTAPIYLILISCIDKIAKDELKIFSKISISFSIIFTVLSSMNYFIQFTAVKFSIKNNQMTGLEQFIQLNPYSFIYGIVILGWTFFLGLSSLFISIIFGNKKIEKVIKYSFIANGLFCLSGFAGYIFNIKILDIIYLSGMGISMILISLSLFIYFKAEMTVKECRNDR